MMTNKQDDNSLTNQMGLQQQPPMQQMGQSPGAPQQGGGNGAMIGAGVVGLAAVGGGAAYMAMENPEAFSGGTAMIGDGVGMIGDHTGDIAGAAGGLIADGAGALGSMADQAGKLFGF